MTSRTESTLKDRHAPPEKLWVLGPLGEPLTLETLPPADTTRWLSRRKAEVVAAIKGGLLSRDQAMARYALTPEELAGWERAVARFGMRGLRTTHAQHYRGMQDREQRFAAIMPAHAAAISARNHPIEAGEPRPTQ